MPMLVNRSAATSVKLYSLLPRWAYNYTYSSRTHTSNSSSSELQGYVISYAEICPLHSKQLHDPPGAAEEDPGKEAVSHSPRWPRRDPSPSVAQEDKLYHDVSLDNVNT